MRVTSIPSPSFPVCGGQRRRAAGASIDHTDLSIIAIIGIILLIGIVKRTPS